MPSKLLTKSKYMEGLGCLRYLWFEINQPDKIPPTEPFDQYRMDEGSKAGELARKLFPKAVNLAGTEFKDNIARTKSCMAGRKQILEAGFLLGDIYARADVLVPAGKDEWDIIEIKAANSVKPDHYQDVAFQKHCYISAGLKIRNCFLLHFNKEYVKKGKLNLKKLFMTEDITAKVDKVISEVPANVSLMLKTIKSDKPPEVGDFDTCCSPSDCVLGCWDFLPSDNVFDLYYGGKIARELYKRKILLLKDIPSDVELKDFQKIQVECAKTGKTHVDKKAINTFLSKLKYPIYFLDFETFGTGVPILDKSKPWQEIPFQFSLHVLDKPAGELRHISFLADGKSDPRPLLIKSLKLGIGRKGTVIAYNASFEERVLKGLAAAFPSNKKWIDNVLGRFVDLLEPFSAFHYYNPSQQGTASLKAVLPAVTGKTYAELEIAEGGGASMAYIKMMRGELNADEIATVRAQLEEYCGLDTEGMVWIIEKMREMVR
jgi:hypothetical protein